MSHPPSSEAIQEIAIIGAGYVGLVTGACFASMGFRVTLVEQNPGKLALLKKGEVPFFEPGLPQLLQDAQSRGRLDVCANAQELFAHKKPEAVFVAVGTPSLPDGSCDMRFVDGAVNDVLEAANRDIVLVLKSTVPVGTAARVKALLASKKPRGRVAVVNNPEFLREGNAVGDFLRPDRIVIGSSESWATEKICALYESLTRNGHPMIVCDHASAELAKLASNLMLAARVSLINQVARLASTVGADIKAIEGVLRSDPRIGSKYLYASLGYGGSCFPKDVQNFVRLCEERGVNADLAQAVHAYNEDQKLFFARELQRRFPRAEGVQVALLGVAFKPETDDIRDGASLLLTQALLKAGFSLRAYDPQAMGPYAQWLRENELEKRVQLCKSAEEALSGADVLLLSTEWQEFQRLQASNLKQWMRGRLLLDGRNIFKPEQMSAAGFDYVGIGRSASPPTV